MTASVTPSLFREGQMLEIRSARKVFYKGQADEKIALNGLDLALANGEFGVVIGTNGAGKSSMLNAISGAHGARYRADHHRWRAT